MEKTDRRWTSYLRNDSLWINKYKKNYALKIKKLIEDLHIEVHTSQNKVLTKYEKKTLTYITYLIN